MKNFITCARSALMYFLWFSEQTAIISLHIINWIDFWRVRKTAKSDY